MPPIILVFTVTGSALFVISAFFLGWGAKADDAGSNPLKTVGAIATAAGIVDLLSALYIVTRSTVPAAAGVWPSAAAADAAAAANAPLLIGGLVGFYGLFFTSVGLAAFLGMDLRPIANLAIPVALVPLAWLPVFSGSIFFQSTLIVWVVAFLSVTATVYGKLPAKALGAILLLTALYTFFLPVILLPTTGALY
ncbi:hypothetical protein [Pseudonocardia sp. N23]|uniref:hypothetical protein n=1 Tax=Pseudonocardia sp. N23 TaxID=1987376 RepID=UPI000BFB99B3|nr:hypothetical protein [Pseudonocardia sp. N23]GAY08872.1 hypothetical protein TOK_2828 [Pseudonocardia sp. N23]